MNVLEGHTHFKHKMGTQQKGTKKLLSTNISTICISYISTTVQQTCTNFITAVLSKLDTTNHLLVYEVSTNRIICRVVPGSKDLLPEEESPWSIPLLSSQLFSVLLTLRDGVHDVVSSTAE